MNSSRLTHTNRKNLFCKIVFLLFALSSLLCSACQFDTSGIGSSCNRSICEGEIFKYGINNPKPNVIPNFAHISPKGWDWKEFKLSDPASRVKFYRNAIHIPRIIPAPLRGSWLLQLDRNWNVSPLSSGVVVINKQNSNIEKFWVAFDSRATTVPTWLSAQFTMMDQQVTVTSSQAIKNSNQFITYRVWQPTQATASKGVLNLGGNNGPGVLWHKKVVGAQYLLLVQSRITANTVVRYKLDKVPVEVCLSDNPTTAELDQAKNEGARKAMNKWLNDQGSGGIDYRDLKQKGILGMEVFGGQCGNIRHTFSGLTVQKTTKKSTDLKAYDVTSWVERSTAIIHPAAASASVTEGGFTSICPLAGDLSFDVKEQNNVEIYAMSLFGKEALLSDGTKVSHLSFGQDDYFTALCNDGLPPGPSRLCSQYIIPTNTLKASGSAQVRGYVIPISMINSQPLFLDVDFSNMSVKLYGGPLSGNVNLGDRIVTVEMSLDITADFDNLAPKARVDETNTYWECMDDDQALVTLSAEASFDQLHPTDIVTYTWFEDVGSISEKQLGTGKVLSLSMNYGVHQITLTVIDSMGIPNSKTFDLEVGDSTKPTAMIPADIYIMRQDSYGAVVDPGQATGSDSCSGQAVVSNNAPAGNHFPVGKSDVIWTVDDQRGNTHTYIQRIFVLDMGYFPPTIPQLILTDLIRFGEILTISYSSEQDEQEFMADFYLTVEGPDGDMASIQPGNEVIQGMAVPYFSETFFGDETTEQNLYESVFSEFFSQSGHYTITARLVQPGADYYSAETVISETSALVTLEDADEFIE